jgi:hypothetical protein
MHRYFVIFEQNLRLSAKRGLNKRSYYAYPVVVGNKMIEKIFKSTYWLFLVESSLILFGILIGVVRYGIDVQTPFMAFGIALGLIIISIIRFSLKKLDTGFKKSFGLIISLVMILLCVYYLVEDKFKIEF